MRIDAFNKISEVYKSSSVASTSKTKSSGFSDSLEISQTAKDYQIAKQILVHVPDIREDKVNDIKERIEAGTYDISMEDVADKLVNQFFEQLA
jgi:negative regulator of flagellin synthesis FlgM